MPKIVPKVRPTDEHSRNTGRANLKPWKPGQSGNAAGRPKAHVVLSEAERRIGSATALKLSYSVNNRTIIVDIQVGKPLVEAVLAILFAKALSGNLRAIEFLLDSYCRLTEIADVAARVDKLESAAKEGVSTDDYFSQLEHAASQA